MRYRYNDKQLYNQLLYFQSIFDVDKTKRGELRPLVDALEESKTNSCLNCHQDK